MNERACTRAFLRYRDRADSAALADVFDRAAPGLHRLAGHLARSQNEADDLVQVTFLRAIERRDSFDARGPVGAWLHGILWREAASARRRAARRFDEHWAQERLEGLVEDAADQQVLATELSQRVADVLEELPDRYREVLRPLLWHDERPEDIAKRLGRSPGTVRSQIHRGLERLRHALPAGLAPTGGFIPGASSLALVREAVLSSARAAHSTSTLASAAPVAATSSPAVIGGSTLLGVLMTKSTLIGALAALVVFSGWYVLRAGGTPVDAEGGSVELAQSPVNPPRPDEVTADVAEESRSRARAISRTAEDVGEAEADPAAEQIDLTYWRERFAEKPDDTRHGRAVAYEIAELPPAQAFAVVQGLWPELSAAVRPQVLKPFVLSAGHPFALPTLALGARDEDEAVLEHTHEYLKAYAFQDFSNDPEAAVAWLDEAMQGPIEKVLTASATDLITKMKSMDPVDRVELLEALEELNLAAGEGLGLDLAAVLREAGGESVLAAVLYDGDEDARERAFEWSRTMAVGEAWLRAHALGTVVLKEEDGRMELDEPALYALSRPDCAWAADTLVAHLGSAVAGGLRGTHDLAEAIGDIQDPRVIPVLIDLMAGDTTGRAAYDIGYFGLEPLTGVPYDESHDAAWWQDWWRENRARFEEQR